jgi:hypothetical protein
MVMITDSGFISDEMRGVVLDFLILAKEALMKKRNTDAQVAFALHRALTGTPVTDIIRKMGFSNLEAKG